MPAHCQVCARAIKDKVGVIAHHGYQRPGHGYQTRSCFGAQHVSYEAGHDALDTWIAHLTAELPVREERLAQWLANPPAELDVRYQKDAYGRFRNPNPVMKPRPDDFSTAKESYAACIPSSYDHAFWTVARAQKKVLRDIRETLDYASARRAAWVAPA